jgi:hypothetical protein
MSTSPTYGFLPFIRRGMSTNLSVPDNPSVTSDNSPRASLDVTVNIAGASVNKTIKLLGPCDILNVSSDMIVKTEPASGVYTFEHNLFPCIEFFDEDFLWRYTPVADINNRLRPWLALVVLKDDEFTIKPPSSHDMPASVVIQINNSSNPSIQNFPNYPDDLFHKYDEHWAWGHVHVNSPIDRIVGETDDQYQIRLLDYVVQNPNSAVCRLMSSRRLEEKTNYTAFLIPAFESGRLVGLGDSNAETTSIQKSSWDALQTEFPIYYQWRFGTSALGDFESLVRALRPHSFDASMGVRDMDITSNIGCDLNGIAAAFPSTALQKGIVKLEAALKPPGAVYDMPQNAFNALTTIPANAPVGTISEPFTTHLAEVLNLTEDINASATNPVPSSSPIYNIANNCFQDDPIVLPPLYGQWHAEQKRVDTNSPLWFQEINLDTRYRAAAGLGAEVVKNRQEEFMEIAWQQVGEVLIANEKIRNYELAIESQKSVFDKHVVGSLNYDLQNSSYIEDSIADKVIKVAESGFRGTRVDLSTASTGYSYAYDGTTPATSTLNTGLKTLMNASRIINPSGDIAFRKVVRNRSKVVNRLNAKTSLAVSVTENLRVQHSDVYTTSSPTLSSFQSPTPSNQPVIMPDYIGANQFIDKSQTIIYYGLIDEVNNPIEKDFISPSEKVKLATDVLNKLHPEDLLIERIKTMVDIQGSPVFNYRKPIMAYPTINLPVYKDLAKISADYLIPNLEKIPNNTVTLFETNEGFVEAYMVGLNHEFARELLWHEYPTDQRGSYFKCFWDKKDDLDITNSTFSNNLSDDIKPIHTWSNNSLSANSRSSGLNYLVLLVRGDLLKKFPNAVIYAQKAKGGTPQPTIETDESLILAADIRFPKFKAHVQPDVALVAFELLDGEALGNFDPNNPGVVNPNYSTLNSVLHNMPSTLDHGWFFVIRERPGIAKFGLDEPVPNAGAVGPLGIWDNLDWNYMRQSNTAPSPKVAKMSNVNSNLNVQIDSLTWGADSAQTAAITYQKPVMVAIHAKDMIKH